MEKLKVSELKNGCRFENLTEYFCDYDHGYICDIITEIADNHVEIYTSDLLEWAKDNYGYIEEAIDEFGTPTDSNGNADFIRMIQQGQFYSNERELYDGLSNGLCLWVYNYIENVLGITEITEEENNELLEWDFDDHNEQLENLIEHIENIFKKE